MAKTRQPIPEPTPEAPKVGGVIAAITGRLRAPEDIAQSKDDIAHLKKDLVLIANELGRIFGEPIKTNLAYILERHEAPPARKP